MENTITSKPTSSLYGMVGDYSHLTKIPYVQKSAQDNWYRCGDICLDHGIGRLLGVSKPGETHSSNNRSRQWLPERRIGNWSIPLYPFGQTFRFDLQSIRHFNKRLALPREQATSPFLEKVKCNLRMAKPVTFECQRKKHSRSEEHTSELQSRERLVCRLLLEKIE